DAAVEENAGADALQLPGVAPKLQGGGHVAAAAQADAEPRPAESADVDDRVPGLDRRRVGEVVGSAVVLHALAPPEDLPVRRVVADEPRGLGADDLVLAGDLDDDRRAPRPHVSLAVGVRVAVALDGFVRLPDGLPAVQIDGSEEDA